VSSPRIGIAAAAAASGLSAHTLRAWERRYGFPQPSRTAGGERLYTSEDVAKLTLLRRLVARGHRVNKVIGLTTAELEALAVDVSEAARSVPLDVQECLRHLSAQSVSQLRRLLQGALVRQGLGRFVLDTARPLVGLVGEWWARGDIAVFQEHLFAEQLERLLREGMAPLDPHNGPIVILTTLPGEQHRLGLLMLEALLRLEGAECVPLGTETPPADLVKLAAMSAADVVALSFSSGYKDPMGRRALAALRRELPPAVAIWAGGQGAVRQTRGLAGVTLLRDLEDGIAASRERARLQATS